MLKGQPPMSIMKTSSVPTIRCAQDALEHYVRRADAAGAAARYGAHQQKLYAVYLAGEHLRQIVNLGAYFEKLAEGVRGGAFPDKLLHFGYRGYLAQLFLGKAQRQPQVCVRVHVGGQNVPSLVGIEPCKDRRQSGFSHSALSCNR
jgi:hypothetical protein